MGARNPVVPEARILAALRHAPLAPPMPEPSAILGTLGALGVDLIDRTDPEYPPSLGDLPDPPPVLFRLGGPLPAWTQAVAIVGSRAATDYGLRLAARLAGDLARLGFTVVSGLARGIDAAAHDGALAAGGATVAVLPSGLDDIAPAQHRPLAARIVAHGALVSERASGPPPHRASFVTRNRLIAALARVTVVVEASATSGALHTAAAAFRLGRIVMAVPGDVDRATSRGTLGLLGSGARPCAGVTDVVAALAAPMPHVPARRASGAAPRRRRKKAGPTTGTTAEHRLLSALGARELATESLAEAAGLELSETLAHLLSLEWSGLAIRVPGGRWRGRRV